MELVVLKFKELITSAPFSIPLLKALPKAGVYLFTENADNLYVGRSDNIRRRFGLHTNPGSQHNQASFAALLAKEETQLKASYKIRRNDPLHYSRAETFLASFAIAKQRIRGMEFRAVEESDPVNQALLEVYVAVVLPTKYNDFRNH